MLCKSHLLAAVLIGGIIPTSLASAATDGGFGATSTGNIGITASVPGRVRISKLGDIDLQNLDPTAEAKNNQNVCVWSNAPSRAYRITASGSGTGNAFTLDAAGAPAEIPYFVQWAGTSGQTSGAALTAGTPLTGLTSAAINSDCSVGPDTTASLIVGISASTAQSMTANLIYTGTLTLTVAPE